MIRILFLIRSLVHHGAERQLTELVKGLDKGRFSVIVVTFYDGGALRSEIEGVEGVQLVSLGKRSRWDIAAFFRLLPVIVRTRPDIIHGYMVTANELGLVAAKMIHAKTVWGLRRSRGLSDLYPSERSWMNLFLNRVTAWLSRFPDLIIVNSHAGRQHYVSEGYCAKRVVVIPNGIDTARFRPDPAARKQTREAWSIAEGEKLVGMVGRFDLLKDHATFLRAAALVSRDRPSTRFVCVGDGPSARRKELASVARELHLESRLIWAGHQSDMTASYNALDILVSSSLSEGFSNVIGEAMACGVPCVVTDVGDSASIVDDHQSVVIPKNPEDLAAACTRLLDLTDEQMTVRRTEVRERIVQHFSVESLVSSTEEALSSLSLRQREFRRRLTRDN